MEDDTVTEKRSYDDLQESDGERKEEDVIQAPPSPPRVKRRNIEAIYSIQNMKLSLC